VCSHAFAACPAPIEMYKKEKGTEGGLVPFVEAAEGRHLTIGAGEAAKATT